MDNANAKRRRGSAGARLPGTTEIRSTEGGCFALAKMPATGYVASGSTSGRQASLLTVSCCDLNPGKADSCAFAWAGTGENGGMGAGAGAGVGRVTWGQQALPLHKVPNLSRTTAALARTLVRCVVPFLRGCHGRMRATGWHLDARIGELRIPLTITMGVAGGNALFPHAPTTSSEGDMFASAVRDPAGGEVASSGGAAKRFTAAAEARIHREGVDIVYEHDILLMQYVLEQDDAETPTAPPSLPTNGASRVKTRRRPAERESVPPNDDTTAERPKQLFVPVVQSGHMGEGYATFGTAWARRVVRVFIDSDSLELYGVDEDAVWRAIRGINAVLRGTIRLDIIDTKPAHVGHGYVHIRGHLTSCMSHLGCVAPSVNAVTLASWAKIGTVVHQLFHTLGLTHPHSAHHRDAHIHVLPQNIARQYLTYFARRPEEATQRQPGEYDISSVMHCHPQSYAKGAGLTTVTPRNQAMAERAALPMGQRQEPTEKDVAILRRLYSRFRFRAAAGESLAAEPTEEAVAHDHASHPTMAPSDAEHVHRMDSEQAMGAMEEVMSETEEEEAMSETDEEQVMSETDEEEDASDVDNEEDMGEDSEQNGCSDMEESDNGQAADGELIPADRGPTVGQELMKCTTCATDKRMCRACAERCHAGHALVAVRAPVAADGDIRAGEHSCGCASHGITTYPL